jgi:hypothetical protein
MKRFCGRCNDGLTAMAVDLALDPRDFRQRVAKIDLGMARIVPQRHKHLAMPLASTVMVEIRGVSARRAQCPITWSSTRA